MQFRCRTAYPIVSRFRDGGFLRNLQGRDRANHRRGAANEGIKRIFKAIPLALSFRLFIKKPS